MHRSVKWLEAAVVFSLVLAGLATIPESWTAPTPYSAPDASSFVVYGRSEYALIRTDDIFLMAWCLADGGVQWSMIDDDGGMSSRTVYEEAFRGLSGCDYWEDAGPDGCHMSQRGSIEHEPDGGYVKICVTGTSYNPSWLRVKIGTPGNF